MSRLTLDRQYAEFDAQAATLAAVLAGADLATPVPTCPDWTLTDLAQHVYRAFRWVSVLVETRAEQPVSLGDAAHVDVPDDPQERTAWLVAGARRMTDTVRAAGPDTPVWTWAPDRVAGFWVGRILHDMLVHRFDTEIALGREPEVAPDLAADSVSDMLMCAATLATGRLDPEVSFPGLRGDGQTLHFHATDEGLGQAGEWQVRRVPSGVEWKWGHATADVAVRGRALDLILVLSRRATPAERTLEVHGDEALLTHWLDHSKW